MTERYLVMPRGINVGRGNRVSMPILRSKLAERGYGEVATVLQSGNVIVSAASVEPLDVADEVRLLLREEFGVDVPCLVRTAGRVREVVERNPLREVASDPSRHLVVFLSEAPAPEEAEALLEEDHRPQAVAVEGAEAYVWTPGGVRAMTLNYAYFEKRFGVVATARNWNTLGRIVAKL